MAKKINPTNNLLLQKGFKQFDKKVFVPSDKIILDAVIKIRKENPTMTGKTIKELFEEKGDEKQQVFDSTLFLVAR